MSFFTAQDICAGYGGKNIVSHCSFSIEEGCLTGLLGANGSGKTTLIKAICGSLPHKGTCTLEGQMLERLSPKALGRRIGYVPQKSGLELDISALDTVMMGFHADLGLLEGPAPGMKKRAAEILDLVGLEGRQEDNYRTLSRGQQQLCLLARAMAADRRMLILDEPESALDFPLRRRMLALVKRWLGEPGRCALVSLHDPALALNHCHRLLLIREGSLLGVLKPGEDDLQTIEAGLSQIYGPVSLQEVSNGRGEKQLVMLWEGQE